MSFSKQKQLNVKVKLGFFVLLPLMVIILLSYFVILPSANKIVVIKQDVEKRRMEIEQKYENRKRMGDITGYFEKVKANIDVLNRPFVNNDQKLEFITSLEDIAVENNVEQRIDLRPQEAVTRDFYEVIPVSITTNGEFKDQFNYLLGLESLDEYININYLQINSASGRSEERGPAGEKNGNRVRFLIKADTFWCDKIKIQ